MWRRPATARITLLLLVCALAAVVAARLARRVPETVEIPLATFVPGMQPMAVELPGAPYITTSGIVRVHKLDLVMERPEDLLRHQSLRLLAGTHDTSPALVGAELSLVGTPCRYVTAPGAKFPNNDMLTLERAAGCSRVRSVPSGALLLTVRFTGDARVALWTYTQPAGIATNGVIRLKGPSTPEFPTQPSLRGSFIDEYRTSGVRVITLLEYMWQLGERSWYLRALLWGAAATIVAAALLCPLGALPVRAKAAAAWRGAAAAGLLAAGLSVVFAIVVPPFQAPDEPNHFLGFMDLGHRLRERPVVDQWAKTTHFNQLRFNGSERFRPVDARQPQETTWADASPSDFDRRSSATAAWRAVAWLTRDQPLPVAFLALRLMHAAMLGAALSAGVFVVIIGAREPFRQLVFVPLLLAPTLPFFGMQVSNHAFLTSAYVLVACGIVLVFLGGPRSCLAGVLLGAGMALGIVAGRSSLPLLPLVAAVIGMRLIPPATPGDRRGAVVFWAGIALSLVGVHLLRADSPPERIAAVLAGLTGPARAVGALIAWPVPFGLAACLAGLFIESRLSASTRPRSDRPRASGGLTRGLAFLAAAGLCVELAASLFVTYPHVPSVDLMNRPPAGQYLASVMATAATPRLRDPDLLLTVSFWGGFGWLDRLLPSWAVALYTALTAGGLIALLVLIARARDAVLFARGAVLMIGAAASMAVYAVGTLYFSPDIHGRYLIGLYLAGLGVCGSPLMLIPERSSEVSRGFPRTFVLLSALGVMYAAVFWFVIGRYF
jgi:hypothetical protein